MFKKFSVLCFFTLTVTLSAQAMNFDIEAALSRTTKHTNCDKKLEKYKELLSRYIKASDDEKPVCLEAMEKQLKKLEKCEKKNKPKKHRTNLDQIVFSATVNY